MKKGIIITLLLVLLTSVAVYADTESNVDDVTSASTWEEEEVTIQPSTVVEPTTTTTPTTSVKVSSDSQVHIVKSGDMLWKIADMYGLTLDELIALNPQLKNPNLLYVGQEIIVKGSASSAVASNITGDGVKVYQGLGHSVVFRNGPGKDSEGVPVYSFNIAMAQATFDEAGRILDVYLDCYEVSTPNYDGESMPHFPGWPDTEGYNLADHETGEVVGVTENTKEYVAAQVNSWKTKRERGDSYHMNPENEWYKQMDFYQDFFVGKTVAELEEWFAKNTTSAGRPIKATTDNQEDLDKLAKLTEEEKAALADVVSGATMSLRDGHGDYLGAIANAYLNRREVIIPVK